MQVETPEVGTEKATTPRYDTIVIRNATGKTVPREVDGGEVIAWSRGHELAAMAALEEFVQDLAAGNCQQSVYLTAGAAEAMNLMHRRRAIGWATNDPIENPPVDWRTAVARTVALVTKVFEDDGEEMMDAILYIEAMLLANEPAVPQPFLFVRLETDDVKDWTQDANLAEIWEEAGYTVAKLYKAPGGAA